MSAGSASFPCPFSPSFSARSISCGFPPGASPAGAPDAAASCEASVCGCVRAVVWAETGEGEVMEGGVGAERMARTVCSSRRWKCAMKARSCLSGRAPLVRVWSPLQCVLLGDEELRHRPLEKGEELLGGSFHHVVEAAREVGR